MDIKGFPERLSVAMKRAGINARELALKAKISPSTLSHYKSGRSTNVTAEVAQKLADAMNISVNWLISGEGERESVYSCDSYENMLYKHADQLIPEAYIKIPVYKLSFSKLDIEPHYEEIEDCSPSTIKASFLRERNILPNNCKRFKVTDDSMSPLIILGDYITVDCSDEIHITNNQIYALIYDRELIIKRLIKTFRNLTIHSDNPKYPDEVFTLEESKSIIKIVGKVIERSGSV